MLKEKKDVLRFLGTIPLSMKKKATMNEIIALIDSLWTQKDISSLVEGINAAFQTLTTQHGDLFGVLRSLQLTLRKWEELGKDKGVITQKDLQKSADIINEEIQKQIDAANDKKK